MNKSSLANGSSVLAHNTKPLPPAAPASPDSPDLPSRMASTIRPVPSHDDDSGRPSFDENAPSEWPSSARNSASALSTSARSSDSIGSTSSPHLSHTNGLDSRPNVRLKPGNNVAARLDASNQAVSPSSRTPSLSSGASLEVPRRESSLGVTGGRGSGAGSHQRYQPAIRTVSPPAATRGGITMKTAAHDDAIDGVGLSATESQLSNGWDSTVGKAALTGKTGRVINRLVSDNEVLKRDIKIEKLKAEEFRQAARLVEDKMERMVAEYESRLLEANVTKALLSRKERQVESLQDAVEVEKQRTLDALERERTWREEMEKVRDESKRQVEQATTHAALMEGRYNAISSHWKDQGDEVNRALALMRREMAELLEERSRDDDKINTLRELCDQQDGNIRDLRRQKEAVTRKFEEYKAEQEKALRDIKTTAAEREGEQHRTLEETRKVLHKLRWALNVKENLRDSR